MMHYHAVNSNTPSGIRLAGHSQHKSQGQRFTLNNPIKQQLNSSRRCRWARSINSQHSFQQGRFIMMESTTRKCHKPNETQIPPFIPRLQGRGTNSSHAHPLVASSKKTEVGGLQWLKTVQSGPLTWRWQVSIYLRFAQELYWDQGCKRP